MTQPRVLILQATGTNRDGDAAFAVEQAGGVPVVMHVNALRERPAALHDYQMLILPGGFSYGDALGAGRLLASDLNWLFYDELARFIDRDKPVLGICNGFQALVKSGWLPAVGGAPARESAGQATLTTNGSNHFECRWVWLQPNPASPCVFTRGLMEWIHCPVAHGEGRFVTRDNEVLETLQRQNQIALSYACMDAECVVYPHNPNGSVANIAGICNTKGNILGLMPHPEDHVMVQQGPRWMMERGGLGLQLFVQGMSYAASV